MQDNGWCHARHGRPVLLPGCLELRCCKSMVASVCSEQAEQSTVCANQQTKNGGGGGGGRQKTHHLFTITDGCS